MSILDVAEAIRALKPKNPSGAVPTGPEMVKNLKEKTKKGKENPPMEDAVGQGELSSMLSMFAQAFNKKGKNEKEEDWKKRQEELKKLQEEADRLKKEAEKAQSANT